MQHDMHQALRRACVHALLFFTLGRVHLQQGRGGWVGEKLWAGVQGGYRRVPTMTSTTTLFAPPDGPLLGTRCG